ncbi:MAG: Fic family protein [Cytophagaceae bacterium]|nr:MAG: Fic family protein [Cytophagaceae bacterium]
MVVQAVRRIDNSSQDFLVLQKLGNPVKKIEQPPQHVDLLRFFSETDQQGKSLFLILNDSDLIKQINEDYLYWDKVKYKVPAVFHRFISPVELWSFIRFKRNSGSKRLFFADEHFSFTATDTLYRQLHEFDLHLGGTFGSQHIIPDNDKHHYLIGSIMEESIASSQIEGAVTSRTVAKEMLRKQRPPRNKSERMIVNNYTTIQHIVANKASLLTPDRLLEIHRLITADTMDKPEETGQFRTHNDIHVVDAVDGELIHTPPDVKTLPAFIEDLCRFFNDEEPAYFLHPIVKASIVHFLIGYFHPFTDGNGRTARALLYWYLLKRGYWLTEYLSISRVIMQSRSQYYKAYQYTEADDNDLGYFVHYQVKAMKQAYDELKKYIDRKISEKKQTVNWQIDGNLSARQAQIVTWVHADSTRLVSVKEVETVLGVSNQTARTDLQRLAEKGYLKEILINQKEKQFTRGPRLA